VASQQDKARAFRALHDRPGAFVIPNAWDAGSAKILASLGFEAVATTSQGLATSLGIADGTGKLGRDDALANCRAISGATDLPVSADLENCYADDADGAARTIRAAIEAGVVGVSIEDASGNAARPIYDFSLAVERVQAAAAVARSMPFPVVFVARADGLLHGRDMDDTVRRLQAFERAGANVLYAPGLRDLGSIRQVVKSVGKPINVVMSTADPSLTVAQLADAGVRRISVGGALSRLALAGLIKGAKEMKERGTFTWVRDAFPTKDLMPILNRGDP
jgi:2-methylisocitrate lyase-like PEP mutase family enzyme